MNWLLISFVYFSIWLFIFLPADLWELCILSILIIYQKIFGCPSPRQWVLFVYGVLYNIQAFNSGVKLSVFLCCMSCLS